MANYTVFATAEYDFETDTPFFTFYATAGLGLNSGSPLPLNAGDTVTFEVDFVSNGIVNYTGLDIFTDNTDFSISAFNNNPVTRTVASGAALADSITGSFSLGGSDLFYFSRQATTADNTPETYTNLGGNKTSAALNTIYYATFSTTTVGTTSPGTGLALGTTIDNGTAISTSNGQWSIDGSTWNTSSGTVDANQTVYFRGTSSSSYNTLVTHSLTIGTVTKSFTTTTLAGDGTPDQFTFTDVTDAALSTTQTSNLITIAGITISVAVSVTGGTYSKNGGAYTSSAGTAVNGDTFRVRHTSSSSPDTAVNTTLTVGGVSDTFTSTTVGADTTPDAFDLGDPVTNVSLDTDVESDLITVSGLNTSTSVSISGTGAAYSKNNGAYTTSAGTAVNGDTFVVRVTSASTNDTTRTGTLNIGGVTDSFSVTTLVAGGSGTGIPSGSAAYGVEIYGADGTKTVLSPTTRYPTAVGQLVTFTLNPVGTTGDNYLVPADMTDLTVSNSILLMVTDANFNYGVAVTREAGGFRVTNTGSGTRQVNALPLRF